MQTLTPSEENNLTYVRSQLRSIEGLIEAVQLGRSELDSKFMRVMLDHLSGTFQEKPIETKARELIELIENEDVTPDQRLEITELLHDSWCPYCGTKNYGKMCYCTNDE